MLRSVAIVALVPLELPTWQRSLAAPRLASWMRLWTRDFAGQSPQCCIPTEPRALLRIPKMEESAQVVAEKKSQLSSLRRFITCPELARVVASHLHTGHRFEGQEAVLLECDPGPGVLTRTLLNSGARVITLESNHSFLPDLESLKAKLHGQLEVVYCDFFSLDPLCYESKMPPVMDSEDLLENLNILPVPWTADVPLKVIGIVPQKRERNLLWKLLYALYKCNSVYSCGRTELNLFMSEKEFKTLTAKPGGGRPYQALSVLWQTACDIQLLHMEPWSSFLTNTRDGRLSIPKSVRLQNDHLCLVRLTPRKDLFTGNLTTINSSVFIMMVKQYLVKCKTRLLDKLHVWPYVDGKKLLRQLEIPENITTGDLYPEQYKYLFELIAHSEEFDQSWLSDSLEDYRIIICES